MKDMHRAGYAGKGVELPCPLQLCHPPTPTNLPPAPPAVFRCYFHLLLFSIMLGWVKEVNSEVRLNFSFRHCVREVRLHVCDLHTFLCLSAEQNAGSNSHSCLPPRNHGFSLPSSCSAILYYSF